MISSSARFHYNCFVPMCLCCFQPPKVAGGAVEARAAGAAGAAKAARVAARARAARCARSPKLPFRPTSFGYFT